MKPRWLDRRVACAGPFLALVLSQAEFDAALRSMKHPVGAAYVKNERSDATTHVLDSATGRLACIVAMSGWEGRNAIEVAGLLVHEAVHCWQEYADAIGEHNPGREQEAYAIQAIAQELMAEFARRVEERGK